MTEQIKKLMENLKKNNMAPYFAENKKEALEIVKTLLPKEATVTHGGSETLKECGIIDYIKQGGFNYLDRSEPGLSQKEIDTIYRMAFFADVYLTSANAVTESGLLYNVDGTSNRVAAILFGPKSVICVVGVNKLVKDIQEAADRVRCIAAPRNTKRLNCPTYCREKGQCQLKDGTQIGEGCRSESCICCNFTVSGQQRQKDRIKVIIVNEDLGY